MHGFRTIPLWKEAPFLRLFIPFSLGILLQWNFFPRIEWIVGVMFFLAAALLIQSFSSILFRFRHTVITGLLVNGILITAGIMITHYNYLPNRPNWIGRHYKDSTVVIARLEEPLTEKARSYKAVASVRIILKNNQSIPVNGRIILYFQKDSFAVSDSTNRSSMQHLQYGSELLFSRSLQPIINTGNPGAFDYKQYAAFQDIYYQVFLTPVQWTPLPTNYANPFKKFLFSTREKIVALLQKNIEGGIESGLAEALLIGYKDDLDKELVQAYSNTGVVHVIAISGLHLGLIYWLLNLLLRPISKRKKAKWIKPLMIIAILWLFSLLAGGSPSVLRSAVMFTCIVLGESRERKISVYNSLAASAFLLLCYDPFWLWDAGFQLSYIAVLSIVVFSKPVYNLIYIPNKLVDHCWKLISVTIAAQILTTPISIYYFHQFPIVFLVTNLVAIPLSSIILLGEILLCAFSFFPELATGIGWIIQLLIKLLNHFIQYIDGLPFAVWSNLSISITQSLFLYGTIIGISCWLLQKNRRALMCALSGLFCFVILRTVSFSRAAEQRKIIIYNIPRHRAIDFINGRNYYFDGDSALLHDDFLQNFHLKASRVLHRINRSDSLPGLVNHHNFFIYGNTRILLVDKSLRPSTATQKLKTDIIIISGNPRLYIKDLLAVTECKQIVIDGSNPIWKLNQWKKDCDEAGIAFHSVSINGAFVMNLP